MPYKMKKPCSFAGCTAFAVDGSQYCAKHRKQSASDYNRYVRRDDIRHMYNTVWKQVRKAYASQHPLCEQCLKDGHAVLMDEVHHILPVSRGGTNDFSNLMSLCRSCHEKIHIEMGDRNAD